VGRSEDQAMRNERVRRVGQNEALYREVNERVLELNDRFGIDQERIDFVCECGHGGCAERISLTRDEYEAVREDGRRFALVKGHEIPDLERVVGETDRFLVVEKLEGGPAEIAEAADPR
jgi:hypothetical protein